MRRAGGEAARRLTVVFVGDGVGLHLEANNAGQVRLGILHTMRSVAPMQVSNAEP